MINWGSQRNCDTLQALQQKPESTKVKSLPKKSFFINFKVNPTNAMSSPDLSMKLIRKLTVMSLKVLFKIPPMTIRKWCHFGLWAQVRSEIMQMTICWTSLLYGHYRWFSYKHCIGVHGLPVLSGNQHFTQFKNSLAPTHFSLIGKVDVWKCLPDSVSYPHSQPGKHTKTTQ